MNVFFIIGAQKGGTTALWQYLKEHPQIAMPAEKETSFFVSERMFQKGWAWFCDELLPGADGVRAIGTADPSYLCRREVAQRIYETVPEAKLIVLLRNPIERAISHYKMMVRWGLEDRSFKEAVQQQLQPDELEVVRSLTLDELSKTDRTRVYLAWGEYKRQLREYLDVFSPDQLLILDHEELLKSREDTYRRVLRFVGVDDDYLPRSLGRMFHVGGNRPRSRILQSLDESKIVWRMAKPLLSKRQRKAVRFWLKTWNSKPGTMYVSGEVLSLLAEHYSDDIAFSSELLKKQLTWAQWPADGGYF